MATMSIKQIHELLAQKLENDLNTYSNYTKFDVQTSYNYQEPSKDLSTINAVMNFSNNNVASIKNLEAYTFPAIVSFYCEKRYANEVMAILTKYISDVKGDIQEIGGYFVIPTYTTPSQSEITMIGQIGESIKVTMYIQYTVYSGLIFTNDMTVSIDGRQLIFDQFNISKRKATSSDNINNNETLQVIPDAQELSFEFRCFLTPTFEYLLDEILGLDNLAKQHTLSLAIRNSQYKYKVILSDASVTGVKGGAMYASLIFSIADGKNGGEV